MARSGGVVVVCVWDHVGGIGSLVVFWDAVVAGDPDALDEVGLAGVREGYFVELLIAVGVVDVEGGLLVVEVRYMLFEVWWEFFIFGVGLVGDYVVSFDDVGCAVLCVWCCECFLDGVFMMMVSVWVVRGWVC